MSDNVIAAGVLTPIGLILSPAVGAAFMALSTLVVALKVQLLSRLGLSSAVFVR